MSHCDVKEIERREIKPTLFEDRFFVKPKGEKWQNFPPCLVFKQFLAVLDRVKDFKVLEDDVFLTGYMRSGTTIAAEMIWLIANDFNFEKATSLVTDDRVPGLEFDDMTQMIQKGKIMNTIEGLSRPRTIKTHLPVQLLPDDVWVKKPKIIYVSRDPRDVAISLFHLGSHYSKSELGDFLDRFMSEKCMMGPYREHRVNYWNIPDYSNILYLTYESMTADIDEAINKVASFLGVTVSDENKRKLKEHLRFDKMKTNTACNYELYLKKVNQMMRQKTETDDFIRRGKAGGYKDEMPQNYIDKFEKWMAEEANLTAGFPMKAFDSE